MKRGAGAQGGMGATAMGAGALAVIWCAAFPLVVGLVGGLTVTGALGLAIGMSVGVLAAGLLVVARRRRHRIEDPAGRSGNAEPN